jgi:hypothetical protein
VKAGLWVAGGDGAGGGGRHGARLARSALPPLEQGRLAEEDRLRERLLARLAEKHAVSQERSAVRLSGRQVRPVPTLYKGPGLQGAALRKAACLAAGSPEQNRSHQVLDEWRQAGQLALDLEPQGADPVAHLAVRVTQVPLHGPKGGAVSARKRE